MSVEASIFNLLKGLVSNRVFPDVAPAGTARPFITFQQVGGETVSFLEKAVASKKNGRFQINVWTETRIATATLSLQVESAMITASAFEAEALGSQISTHEPETKLYGAMQDFSIWSNR